jgi:hypothetical protein
MILSYQGVGHCSLTSKFETALIKVVFLAAWPRRSSAADPHQPPHGERQVLAPTGKLRVGQFANPVLATRPGGVKRHQRGPRPFDGDSARRR